MTERACGDCKYSEEAPMDHKMVICRRFPQTEWKKLESWCWEFEVSTEREIALKFCTEVAGHVMEKVEHDEPGATKMYCHICEIYA